MNKYKLADSITEIIINALQYFDQVDSGKSAVSVADTTSTISVAYMRYCNDPVFRAKVTMLVANIIDTCSYDEDEIAKLKQERDHLAERLQYAKEQALISETIEKRLMQQLKDAETQRDEAVALVEVKDAALERLAKLGNGEQYGNSIGNEIAREALSITGPDALREIQARTLDEAAENAPDDASERYCRAAAKRKGE